MKDLVSTALWTAAGTMLALVVVLKLLDWIAGIVGRRLR